MADDAPDKEQKTEPATGKRRSEARSKGMVARSQDLNSAVLLTAGLAILTMLGSWLSVTLTDYFRSSLVGNVPREMTPADFVSLVYAAASKVLPVIAAIGLLLVAVGAAVSYGQVGFQISTKAIQWDLNRINPFRGFKNLIQVKTLVRAGLAIIKASIIVSAAYFAVRADLAQISLLDRSQIELIVPFMGSILFRAAVASCVALIVVGIGDFFFERWQFERDIKMTKQEVKEEGRQMEGDPVVKSQIRKKQREMAMRRMMAEVPKATVVVTNPTHYAVALKYKTDEDKAPKIVAKGKDLVAKRIREIAQENSVPIIENPPLAQGLYKGGEVGEEIPQALYRAVAELLSYVFRLRGRL